MSVTATPPSGINYKIGNGDITSASDVARRRGETGIAGVMIGRAAMSAPWIFQQLKHELATGETLPTPDLSERWALIQRHCQLAVEEWQHENNAIRSMRSRLMAYSKGFPASKLLREKFQRVATLGDLEQIASEHLASCAEPAAVLL